MKTFSKADLESFKQAIQKDYGIELKNKALYETAFNLLRLFESLVKFDKENQESIAKRFENRTRQPIESPTKGKENE